MRTLWATLLLLGILVSGVVGVYVWYETAIRAPGPGGASIELTIPTGASRQRIAKILIDAHLVSEPLALQAWLRIEPQVPAPKAGRHELDPNLPFPALFEQLSKTPLSEDVSLTLVEGLRLFETDQFLTEQQLIEPGAYLEAASSTVGYTLPFPINSSSLAGYLLPETYKIRPGKLDVRALIQRQLNAFNKRFYEPHQKEIQEHKYSLNDLVILASLLEKEEPKPEVRPLVAGVLYNRLNKKTPLGVDATSRYTLRDWSNRKAFLKKLRDPKDPWNTRLRPGLPPGPIGAPSYQSLVAALHPQPSRNWYYLHDKEQNIHFSRTAAEHEAKRRKYNVW